MSGTELRVLEIIWDWGGEASVDIIAREAGISTDYTRLICKGLGRNHYIDFLHQKLSQIRSKGKLEVAKRKFSGRRGYKKITIPERSSHFGFSKPRRNVSDILRGRDKRGRLTLGY